MSKKYTLDVFELLNRINDPAEVDIYAALSTEERAAFAPLVIMRWMSGSSDAMEISALNEFVNPYIFSLGKHPHLLLRSMQACSSKKRKRYNWLPTKAVVKNRLTMQVLQEALGMSAREVQKMRPPPASEILNLATAIGWQADDITKLKKELGQTK